VPIRRAVKIYVEYRRWTAFRGLFGGPYPFIQTGEVRAANRFLTSFTETYSEFGLSQSRLWPKGTVCITIAANIAETAILAIDACFPDSVVGFTADDERTTPSYVEFFLRTARDELAAFAPATAQKNINLDILSRIRLPIAPLDEQGEIVDRIEKAFPRSRKEPQKASQPRRRRR
jgi:type I restriction enzyme, S subunit